MKELFYNLVYKIVLEILTDLLDDGKINNSNKNLKNDNPPS